MNTLRRKISLSGLICVAIVHCGPGTNYLNQRIMKQMQQHSVAVANNDNRIVGSGFFINADGRIITAYHVVELLGPEIQVEYPNGSIHKASLIEFARRMDLALLQGPPYEEVGDLEFRKRSSLQVGEVVHLVGAPYGLKSSYLKGHIMHTNRIDTDPIFLKIPFIQVAGLSYPGCSGAAVYDSQGLLIGMNRATYGNSPGNGIGLTIPEIFINIFIKNVNQ